MIQDIKISLEHIGAGTTTSTTIESCIFEIILTRIQFFKTSFHSIHMEFGVPSNKTNGFSGSFLIHHGTEVSHETGSHICHALVYRRKSGCLHLLIKTIKDLIHHFMKAFVVRDLFIVKSPLLKFTFRTKLLTLIHIHQSMDLAFLTAIHLLN